MELHVPSVEELVVMPPAAVEGHAHVLEVARRRVEAATALMVQRVDDSGAFVFDGHKNVAAWGQATNNWSPAETRRFVRLARAFKWLPKFAESALSGAMGVDAMHAVGQLAANPRVREHLAEADELFTNGATELTFEEFYILLRHWEAAADTDGARQRHDRAMLDRRASVGFAGERAFLDAAGPSYDGVIFDEVLTHFADLEWRTEWDILSKVHGDAMTPALMERTAGQRKFDALQRIFRLAADSPNDDGTGPAVTIEITIDQATFEHQLEQMLGGDPEPIPPSHAARRRCDHRQRHILDPRTVVAASLVGQVRRKVLAADGVVLDMGRRQRLFTGALRDAVLAASPFCTYVGCRIPGHHCEADHLIPFARGGPTNARNGGPACGHHNLKKNDGTITMRDAKGRWRTYRPDGTEIGWPTIRLHLFHPHVQPYALDLIALAHGP